MPFPAAPGVPTFDQTWIHAVWSPKVLETFYDSTVLGSIANTDYEGEIKQMGDSVEIRTRPKVTVRKYVKGQKLQYESGEPDKVTLKIDQGYYAAVSINDVDEVQSDIAIENEYQSDMAEQFKITQDTDVLGTIYLDVHAQNKGATAGRKSSSINLGATGSPIAITKTNVADYIAYCAQVLNEQNAPKDGRWMVIPEWMRTHIITNTDLKDASITGDGTSTLRSGLMGEVDGIKLYQSNLVSSVTDGADLCFRVLFGHKVGLAYAAQIEKTEPLRSQDDFADLLRSLLICGWKVVKSEALGLLYCKRG